MQLRYLVTVCVALVFSMGIAQFLLQFIHRLAHLKAYPFVDLPLFAIYTVLLFFKLHKAVLEIAYGKKVAQKLYKKTKGN